MEVGSEQEAGWGAEKGKQGTSFLFFILDVKSYLPPHCSSVGVCQQWVVAAVLLGWRGVWEGVRRGERGRESGL